MALPSEYTQLDYIESTGTQYIDTGVNTGNQGITLEAEVMWTKLTSKQQLTGGNNYHYFGIDAAGYYYIGSNKSSTVKGSTDRYDHVLAEVSAETGTSTTSLTRTTTINGVVAINDEVSVNNADVPICIFNVGNGAYPCHCRIKWFKVSKVGVLLRDFVPALRNSDGVAGLYDLVNGVFYTNNGTGVFTYPGYIAPKEGHNVLINGTAYAVNGGKVLVGGTVYDVACGKTLVAGTVFEIPVVKLLTVNLTHYVSQYSNSDLWPWYYTVQINGIAYSSSPQAVQVPEGASLKVTSKGDKAFNVDVNGGDRIAVAKGGSYSFTVTKNTEVMFADSGTGRYDLYIEEE